jgi:Family of unknown function (DUF6186)
MSRVIIISLFALVGIGLAVVGLLSRRETARVPSLGDISAFVMDYRVGRVPVGRIAVLGFWWWVGWHFFAR